MMDAVAELKELPIKAGTRFKVLDYGAVGREAAKFYIFRVRQMYAFEGHTHVICSVEKDGQTVPLKTITWHFKEASLMRYARGGHLQIAKEGN